MDTESRLTVAREEGGGVLSGKGKGIKKNKLAFRKRPRGVPSAAQGTQTMAL